MEDQTPQHIADYEEWGTDDLQRLRTRSLNLANEHPHNQGLVKKCSKTIQLTDMVLATRKEPTH